MGSSTAVIDPRFCFPGEILLTIVKKIVPVSAGNFRVSNDKGDIMFNVKERLLSFHSRHVLLHAAGKGATKDGKFTRDTAEILMMMFFSATQFRTGELYVILGHKKEKNAWDFKVVGSWLERSCIIYDHLTAIAQVQRKHGFRCEMKGRGTLSMTMSPNVVRRFGGYT